MRCKDLRFDLIDYVKGKLSPGQAAQIDNHLQECAGCRDELEDIKKFSVTLDNYKVDEPDENFFINFVPALNEKLSARKPKSFFTKTRSYALSFSTGISVIVLTVLLSRVAHQPVITETVPVKETVVQVETPKIEELEPSVINYEHYVSENLLSKIENKETIEKKATKEIAAAVIEDQSDLLFSKENIASYIDNLSDEEVDKVIEKLKSKDILQ